MPLRVSCLGPLLRLACFGGGGPVPVPPYLAWGYRGGGRAPPGGGAFYCCEGSLGSGAPPPPTARPLGGLLGSAINVLWRGRAGVGTLLCPLGLHALSGLRAAGRVRGVRVPEGGLGGGGACAGPPVCAAGGGPVGRGVALLRSIPLPSLGRQQSGCHWRRSVHGGSGPPYHSGSCSPAFSGRDLCGVLARWRRLACSPRPLWEPAAGAGGRVALRLLSRAGGGTNPPCPGGWGPGPPRLAGRLGGWGEWERRALPAPLLGGGLPYSILAPPGVVGALPSGVRVRSGSRCRPRLGRGEGRPVDRSPGGSCRPEPPLCPP